jgi:hypothetical protein
LLEAEPAEAAGPWDAAEISSKEALVELVCALRWRDYHASVDEVSDWRSGLERHDVEGLRQMVAEILGGVAVSRKSLAAGLAAGFDADDVVPSIEAIADKLNADFPDGMINGFNSDYEQWGGTPDAGYVDDEGDD